MLKEYETRARARKSCYGGETLQSPVHCCDVTKPPYLFCGELCTSPLHSKSLFVYTVCCRRGGQCFAVLRTRKSDVILMQWATVVGEVTSPSSDIMCHSCAPVKLESKIINYNKNQKLHFFGGFP